MKWNWLVWLSEGREFWLMLALPTLIFFLAFLLIIWGLQKGKYPRSRYVYAFLGLMLFFVVLVNSIRYFAVYLVRHQKFAWLEFINDMIDFNQYVLAGFCLLIFYDNRKLWALLPVICTLTIPAIYHYSIWLVSLTIWYAQAYVW